MIWVTRASPQGEATVSDLKAEGFEAFHEPLLRITKKDVCYLGDRNADLLLFTSANGVMYCPRDLDCNTPVVTVGVETAKAARKKGFQNVQSVNSNGCDMLEFLRKEYCTDIKIIHVCGRDVTNGFNKALSEYFPSAENLVVYQADAVQCISEDMKNCIKLNNLSGVLFFSPRTVRVFKSLIKTQGDFQAQTAYCLSAAIADCLDGQCFDQIMVAQYPRWDAMLKVIKSTKHESEN